jgi:ABC-2 type transport system permease protein
MRASLTYVVGMVLFGARIPTPGDALAFLVAMTLAAVVSFGFSFIVNLTSFWLVDASGIMGFANILMMFFSGFLLPLAFFPPALQAVASVLPFQAITSIPAQVWLGKVEGDALVRALALQVFWVVTLAAVGLVVLRQAMRKVVIQGG